jgi:FkbM family methyltransferase
MSNEAQPDLIYDIGVHTGEDSDFYLKLGYRVVGIEANPELAKALRERYSSAIAQGRYILVDKAIADSPGEITFFVNRGNTAWSTIDAEWAKRNDGLGTDSEAVTVPAVPLADIMREHGVPHYVKIDVEGADMLCVEGLGRIAARPDYVSIESNKTDWKALLEEFDALDRLGYTRFKAVNQRKHRSGTYHTRNGQTVDHTFGRGASGPFGEALDGPWLSREEVLHRYRSIFRRYRLMGDNTLIDRILRPIPVARRLLNWVSWYDTHAAR